MHIAAAEWIMPLACSRGSAICMADKLLLLAMWRRAPYDLRGPATGKQVYPSRRLLAEETGQTLDAVRDQLRRLLAAGWVRVDGEGWALAWVTPFEVKPATLPPEPAVQVADMQEQPGGSSRLPQATLTQTTATLTAGVGDSNRRPSEQELSTTPDEQTIASKPAPDVSPVEPRKTRARKPPKSKPGQVGLPIDDAPEADADADLLAEHERLRAAALVAAGRQATPLPGKTTRDGRALRLGLRKAVEVHGVEVCKRVLAWQGARWLEEPGQLEWSTHNVWSSNSLAKTIRWSAGQAQAKARASPPRSLPIEPGAPAREYVFDWNEPT